MTDEALVIADDQGIIRLWNAVAVELFGHAELVTVGASLDLIVPESFRVRHWIGYKKAWAEGIGDTQRIALMPVLCADGEVRRFPGHLLPIKGPHGGLAAVAGIYSRPSGADANLFVMG